MKSGFVTVERTFTCSDCFFYELSFRNCHLPVDNLLINFNYENFVDFNPYLEMLNNHFNWISNTHLNTQSLLWTFDDFEAMLDTYEFNVIALTETWLRDYEHLINHVQISGYNLKYNNRFTGQCGGGVGMYIKDNMNYKHRQVIIKIDKSVEHPWSFRHCKLFSSSYEVTFT